MSEHDHDQAPDDPLPGLIASVDQIIATAPLLARGAMGYFLAFKAEGFDEAQALYLTAVKLTEHPGRAG